MTVIYSDFGDTDTQVLAILWEKVPDVNLVHITRNTRDEQRKVQEALAIETDTLLLCGHGTPDGLLSPSLSVLIGAHNVRSIKARRVIGVWCDAAQFAEKVGLKGFFSSMFISNPIEACLCGCFESNAEVITQQEMLFCKRVNRLILAGIPINRWVDLLQTMADKSIDIVEFNYNGLRFFS